jgi:hypothetical protein
MRNLVAIAVLALIVLVVGSCGKSTRAGSPTDYYPLTVGSVWKYRSYYDSAGKPDVEHPTQRSTVRIARKDKLAGGEEAVMVVTRNELPYVFVETTFVRQSEGYILEFRKRDSKTSDTLLAVPPAQGKGWHRVIGGPISFPARFVDQQAVTVKAGTYPQTWHTVAEPESPLPPGKISSWYAPGVGLVKYRSEAPRKDGSIFAETMELTDVNVK